MRWLFAIVLILPMQAWAQSPDPALAEIKGELDALTTEIETLRQLALAERQSGQSVAPIGPVVLRLDRLEGDLRGLTGRVEALENRINRVVSDGTTRIGDLEFRLTELAGGDLAALGTTEPLGGTTAGPAPAPTANADAQVVPTPKPRPERPAVQQSLAIGESADFDAAKAQFAAGDTAAAALGFSAFLNTYPGSPFAVEARYHLALAQRDLGQARAAARSFLDTFTAEPEGPRAGASLFHVGDALGKLGQTAEACRTMDEVMRRFPGSNAALDAFAVRGTLNCG